MIYYGGSWHINAKDKSQALAYGIGMLKIFKLLPWHMCQGSNLKMATTSHHSPHPGVCAQARLGAVVDGGCQGYHENTIGEIRVAGQI